MLIMDYITIKEYAEIRGCSVAAVYQRMNTTLKQYAAKVDNKKVLKIEALTEEELFNFKNSSPYKEIQAPLKEAETKDFEGKFSRGIEFEVKEEVKEVDKKKALENDNVSIVEFLKEQLREKDRYINQLQSTIEEMRAAAEKQLEHNRQLENNMIELLSQSNELNRNNQVLLLEAKERKKGFFRKLFLKEKNE